MLLYLAVEFSCFVMSFSVFCPDENIRWVPTECNRMHDRWLVPVPKSRDVCLNSTLPPPRPALPCEFKCPHGYVLNLTSQECTPCRPGTYFVTGDINLQSFTHLPPSFHVGSYSPDESEDDCEIYWYAVNDNLGVMPVSHCISVLSYNMTLDTSGHLSFMYLSPKRNLFWFQVENKQCRSESDTYKLRHTVSDEYKEFKIKIKEGKYVFKWFVTTFKEDDNDQFTFIKSISISGTSFVGNCSLCPPGTFSNVSSSSRCYNCPANFYSDQGSDTCHPCPESQFSVEKSSRCYNREPCTKDEYATFYAPCNHLDLTFAEYKWIIPQSCNPKLPGSVNLPPRGVAEKCHRCNPGMFKDHENVCQFCPAGTFISDSDTANDCLPCPLGYVSDKGIFYSNWNTFPPFFGSACIDEIGNNCKRKYSWRPNKDYLVTVPLQEADKYQVLFVSFRSSKTYPDLPSIVSFTFSVRCTGTCLFIFSAGTSDYTEIIRTWNFKQNMSHSVVTYKSEASYQAPNVTFHFIFLRSSSLFRHLDEARFFSFNITNVEIGGAYQCIPCPSGVSAEHGCFACPHGYFPLSGKCEKCPDNTIVPRNVAVNNVKCTACPNLTLSSDYDFCFLPCQFTLYNMSFDLSNLSTISFDGLERISEEGFEHTMSFSVCGKHIIDCKDPGKFEKISRICLGSYVKAMKKQAANDLTMDTFKISIGDELTYVDISFNISYDVSESDNKDAPEIVLHYKTRTDFIKCPITNTYVHLRCNSYASNVTLSFPPGCSLGRCSHCDYHIILRSPIFCPLCHPKFFPVFKGECHFGTQKLHRIVPSYCSSLNYVTKETTSCSTLSYELKLLLALIASIVTLLLAVSIYWWKRTKSIEYQYHKLVHSVDHDENIPDNSCLDIEEPKGISLKKNVSKAKQSIFKGDREEMESLTLTAAEI